MMPGEILDGLMGMMLLRKDFKVPAGHYLGLFPAQPADGGENEVDRAGYARRGISFEQINGHATSNSIEIPFPEALESWGRISHFGIFDEPAGGRLLMSGPLDEAKIVTKGDEFRVKRGQIVVSYARSSG